jgi:hypothetical protein
VVNTQVQRHDCRKQVGRGMSVFAFFVF